MKLYEKGAHQTQQSHNEQVNQKIKTEYFENIKISSIADKKFLQTFISILSDKIYHKEGISMIDS